MSELTRARRSEGLVAALLLLGPLILAIPGPLGPLHQAFAAVELTGTGFTLLFALPVAWLMVWRPSKRSTVGASLVIGLWLVFELSAMVNEVPDTLERDRELSLLIVGVILCSSAAALRESGRAVLGRLLCLLTLLLLLPPLVEAAFGATRLMLSGGDPADAIATLAGVSGNPGETSNAAIPGGLFGVLLASRARGPWRTLGAVAAGCLLLHAVFAPALTTLVVAAVVGVIGSITSRMHSLPGARTRAPLVFAIVALTLVLGRVGLRALPSGPVEEQASATELEHGAGSDFGGLQVRRLIASSSMEALGDAPITGHGPGQFVTAFPPYRDPHEIDLSTHGRTIGAETEVEHAHSDLILALVEAGSLGGLCFLILLLHALSRVLRALKRGDDTEAGLALGLGALVLVSFLHAPFLHHPLSSALGFILLGTLSSSVAGSAARGTRWFALALAVLLTAHSHRALDITRHGGALAELGADELELKQQELIVERMLVACPDSVIGLTRRARLLPYQGASTPERVAAWEEVLELRPHRVEAWVQSGVALARDGQLEPARVRFERAHVLDPHHPAVLRNLARVEFFRTRSLAGTDLLDELAELGHEDKLWRLGLATDLLLEGLHEEAVAVLERCQLRFRNLSAERCFQLAIDYRRTSGDPIQARIADAFECTAHRLWARRHAEGTDWDAARRSFRQAIRLARRDDLSLPPRFELEFAAILWRSRMPIDAREAIERAGSDAVAWSGLPAWAGATLLEIQRTEGDG